MRTLAAGTRVLRRTPLAMLPMTAESLAVAILVALGAFPRGAESAAAAGVFPLGVYFDLKQSLAFSASWFEFAAAILLGLLVRSAVLGFTLWFADGRHGSPALPWGRATCLAATGLVFLVPAAVFMYLGAILRYAPFIWIGAAAGLFPAVALARRAASLDAGVGPPRGSGLPEVGGFLTYAYLVCALGASVSTLDRISPLLAAGLLACLGPLHALFLLGWREHLRTETFPGGGTLVVGVTAIAIAVLMATTFYDRVVRDGSPVSTADAPGRLLLLGGADSTSKTGSLTELDPRDIGFAQKSTTLLSYEGAGTPYKVASTRRDLVEVAEKVAAQIRTAEEPQLLLGHSQAALILDRIIGRGLPAPDRSVILAPPPPLPPPMTIPPPGENGEGRVGGDVARAMASAFDAIGSNPYDIDAPASPTNLEPVVVIDKKVSRVAVWALGDSVWLDSDWRRPGELNLIAVTDHVGVTNNVGALDAARAFLMGKRVDDDEVSWRSFAATAIRYAFEPWRPG